MSKTDKYFHLTDQLYQASDKVYFMVQHSDQIQMCDIHQLLILALSKHFLIKGYIWKKKLHDLDLPIL